jgi:transcriptional regulator with XRE-family HTH domain
MVNIEKIKSRLSELKLTKKQLLERCGFTRVTLDKILQGSDMNVKTLEALARGLDVPVGYLFDEEDSKQQKEAEATNAATEILLKMIESKDKQIREQAELIGSLRLRLEQLQDTLENSVEKESCVLTGHDSVS